MGYFKYFLLAFLIFSLCNPLCGFFEYSLMGPYSNQAVWAPFYDLFLAESSEEGSIKMTMPTLDESDDTEEGSTWDTIVQAASWNFTIFDSGVGEYFRFFFLIPISAAFLFAMGVMFLSVVIPWFRGG